VPNYLKNHEVYCKGKTQILFPSDTITPALSGSDQLALDKLSGTDLAWKYEYGKINFERHQLRVICFTKPNSIASLSRFTGLLKRKCGLIFSESLMKHSRIESKRWSVHHAYDV